MPLYLPRQLQAVDAFELVDEHTLYTPEFQAWAKSVGLQYLDEQDGCATIENDSEQDYICPGEFILSYPGTRGFEVMDRDAFYLQYQHPAEQPQQ